MSETAVVLTSLKLRHNLESVLRAAANFGCSRVHWTGTRVTEAPKNPRPKRARDRADDYQMPAGMRWSRERDDILAKLKGEGYTLVAVEITPQAQLLDNFTHPAKAAYVFGPEDGNLDPKLASQCAHTVKISSNGCLNVAMAATVVLHDRSVKARKQDRNLRVA